MIIIFLPPILDDNYIHSSDTEVIPSKNPNVSITKIHKSPTNSLLIYQIESITPTTASLTSISSQKSHIEMKILYQDLKFELVEDLIAGVQYFNRLINVFGVVLDLQFKEDQKYKCTHILLYDFDISKQIVIKLWRGLAAWISSLSIGSRIQVRNLQLRDFGAAKELHSTSSTEIFLLAQTSADFNNKKLSSRIDNLNQKELDILSFLNHQSLLIPKSESSSNLVQTTLSFPFYLEFNSTKCTSHWILRESSSSISESGFKAIRFTHFDAKIWERLSDLFKTPSINTSLLFDKLKSIDPFNFDFVSSSSFQIIPSIDSGLCKYNSLLWTDLVSAKVALFGTFEIEGVLDFLSSTTSTSEESLGNLSILPEDEQTQKQNLILKCPQNQNLYIAIDHTKTTESQLVNKQSRFVVNVKTVFNEGNVCEIIRKQIFIIN